MSDRLTLRTASRRPGLRADDPLSLLLNSDTPYSCTIGIWSKAENCIHPVRATINAEKDNSVIPKTLVEDLDLRCFPTSPDMQPGFYAEVHVRDAIENCGIPDMPFNVRVGDGEVLVLGRNALRRAAQLRAG